jgi:hypothetical protein
MSTNMDADFGQGVTIGKGLYNKVGVADILHNIQGIKKHVGRNNQRALRRMIKTPLACAGP